MAYLSFVFIAGADAREVAFGVTGETNACVDFLPAVCGARGARRTGVQIRKTQTFGSVDC